MTTPTEQYRTQQLALRAVTIREMLELWPALRPAELEATFPIWMRLVAALVIRNRAISYGLSSGYLRQVRAASGVPGAPVLVAQPELPSEKLVTAMRVTSVVAMRRSFAAGKSLELARRDALVQSSGAASRLVLESGRDTVIQSTKADPKAAGWRRVVSAKACKFCLMLADRGAVYKEHTADFASHDHCSCTAEPVYR